MQGLSIGILLLEPLLRVHHVAMAGWVFQSSNARLGDGVGIDSYRLRPRVWVWGFLGSCILDCKFGQFSCQCCLVMVALSPRALEFRVDTPGTLSLNGNKRAAQNAQSVRLSTTPLARATSWSRFRIFPGCVFRCVGAVWRFRDNCLGLGSNEDL